MYFGGCTSPEKVTPSNTPTIPGHFYPKEGSSINFEFYYPPEWGNISELDINISDDIGKRTIPGGRILFTDPTQGEDPCLDDPDDQESFDVDCGDARTLILLRVWDLDLPSDWVENQFEEIFYLIDNIWNDSLVEDRVIDIDGMPARVLVTLSEGNRFHGKENYYTTIYFQRDSVGYLFKLFHLYPEDLDGVFHQAFLDIISSMRFLDR